MDRKEGALRRPKRCGRIQMAGGRLGMKLPCRVHEELILEVCFEGKKGGGA